MSVDIKITDKLTNEDLLIFADQEHVTLAQWHNKLNGWGWPWRLSNKEKAAKNMDEWREINKGEGQGRRHQLMEAIMKIVGHRLISWEHNKKRMTAEEFDDFFRGTYEGDLAARARHKLSVEQQIAKEMENDEKKN